MRNAHGSTWNITRKLKIRESQKEKLVPEGTAISCDAAAGSNHNNYFQVYTLCGNFNGFRRLYAAEGYI